MLESTGGWGEIVHISSFSGFIHHTLGFGYDIWPYKTSLHPRATWWALCTIHISPPQFRCLKLATVSVHGITMIKVKREECRHARDDLEMTHGPPKRCVWWPLIFSCFELLFWMKRRNKDKENPRDGVTLALLLIIIPIYLHMLSPLPWTSLILTFLNQSFLIPPPYIHIWRMLSIPWFAYFRALSTLHTHT